jgi:hypothetical protein
MEEILELQAMDTPEPGGHGGGGGSVASLLLCDSSASVLVCL